MSMSAQIAKVAGLEREVFAHVHLTDRNGHLVRDFAHEVRALLGMLAEQAGEKSSREADATPELTVYRASHDSIVMGLYTTREAAMDHVHATLANEEGSNVTARVIWRADDPTADEPEWECWLFDTDMADDNPTGYVVTPLEVASQYDEEADE